MSTLAEVILWGTRIGVVELPDGERTATFQYDPDFLPSGIEVSPLVMPLRAGPYSFPALAEVSFHGLPGLLADSLPDKYGNALIDAWLATQGRRPEDFNAVERLSYTGARGMGALEFRPVTGPTAPASAPVNIDALVELASQVLTHRQTLNVTFAGDNKAAALREILRVGTSAGGARAKAVIAWNPDTNEVRSGQLMAPPGFEYWLIKFDGVEGNKDKDLADPKGYGVVEYAYSQMAVAAGVEMSACRLFEEGGRRHFMTQRFDRAADGDKLHMQSLAALAHYDFNVAGAYAYEQAFLAIRQLRLVAHDIDQQFLRMAFNVLARNQDDHVKNIAFLMDRSGTWRLSPAYDVTWAYNPTGDWTSQHQMSVNGKRDNFIVEDLLASGKAGGVQNRRLQTLLRQVHDAVSRWPEFAGAAGVRSDWIDQIAATHRLELG
ncbi:MAG TPA: HipA domain-containing protein [Caulobacteraceae bacterium]